MILQPAIMALLLASAVTTVMVVAAAGFGLQVLRHWDLSSCSQRQLILERRTYLISTLLGFAFAIGLASLLLFVFNADRMATQFVGAMCAVGTLNANDYGFPAIQLKLVNFLLAGVWLVMNHADSLGWDYPLIRAKYRLLLVIAPAMMAETVVQALYFLGLDADVITSCCGSIFSAYARSVAAEMAALPPLPSMIGFYAVMAATMAVGLRFVYRQRGGILFAGMSAVAFAAAIMSMISFISIYIYEHPHHHCPFDVIQSGYGHIGYALYLPLFAATVLGLGVGATTPFATVPSLAGILPGVRRTQAGLAVALLALFVAVTTGAIATSNLVLLE